MVEFPDYDHGWKWRGGAEFAAGRPLAWLDDEHDEHDEHAGGEAFAAHPGGHANAAVPRRPRAGAGFGAPGGGAGVAE